MEPTITKICEASNAVFVFHIDSGFILGTKGRLRFNAVNTVCNTLRCDTFGSDYDHSKTCLFSLFIVPLFVQIFFYMELFGSNKYWGCHVV